MFGQAPKRAKPGAAAKLGRLHSIAAMMRERTFAGSFDVAGVNYHFTYTPAKGVVAGNKLQLIGGLRVSGERTNVRVAPNELHDVRRWLQAICRQEKR